MDTQVPKDKKGILGRLRAYFLTGLVVSAPIGITIFLAWKFISMMDKLMQPLIPEQYFLTSLPGVGVVIAAVILILLGALTANLFGRALINLGENIVGRMPIIRGIYSTLKQIFETAVSPDTKSFSDVVLVEYPRKGIWAIAFVSGINKSEIKERLGGEIINVFLPTTPNPTSGFLLFLPKEDLIYLDMSPEDGAKYVISAGLVSPENFKLKTP